MIKVSDQQNILVFANIQIKSESCQSEESTNSITLKAGISETIPSSVLVEKNAKCFNNAFVFQNKDTRKVYNENGQFLQDEHECTHYSVQSGITPSMLQKNLNPRKAVNKRVYRHGKSFYQPQMSLNQDSFTTQQNSEYAKIIHEQSQLQQQPQSQDTPISHLSTNAISKVTSHSLRDSSQKNSKLIALRNQNSGSNFLDNNNRSSNEQDSLLEESRLKMSVGNPSIGDMFSTNFPKDSSSVNQIDKSFNYEKLSMESDNSGDEENNPKKKEFLRINNNPLNSQYLSEIQPHLGKDSQGNLQNEIQIQALRDQIKTKINEYQKQPLPPQVSQYSNQNLKFKNVNVNTTISNHMPPKQQSASSTPQNIRRPRTENNNFRSQGKRQAGINNLNTFQEQQQKSLGEHDFRPHQEGGEGEFQDNSFSLPKVQPNQKGTTKKRPMTQQQKKSVGQKIRSANPQDKSKIPPSNKMISKPYPPVLPQRSKSTSRPAQHHQQQSQQKNQVLNKNRRSQSTDKAHLHQQQQQQHQQGLLQKKQQQRKLSPEKENENFKGSSINPITQSTVSHPNISIDKGSSRQLSAKESFRNRSYTPLRLNSIFERLDSKLVDAPKSGLRGIDLGNDKQISTIEIEKSTKLFEETMRTTQNRFNQNLNELDKIMFSRKKFDDYLDEFQKDYDKFMDKYAKKTKQQNVKQFYNDLQAQLQHENGMLISDLGGGSISNTHNFSVISPVHHKQAKYPSHQQLNASLASRNSSFPFNDMPQDGDISSASGIGIGTISRVPQSGGPQQISAPINNTKELRSKSVGRQMVEQYPTTSNYQKIEISKVAPIKNKHYK